MYWIVLIPDLCILTYFGGISICGLYQGPIIEWVTDRIQCTIIALINDTLKKRIICER